MREWRNVEEEGGGRGEWGSRRYGWVGGRECGGEQEEKEGDMNVVDGKRGKGQKLGKKERRKKKG